MDKKPIGVSGSGFDLQKLEEKVLASWKAKRVFEKSLERRKTDDKKKTFVFYEGPPYANGKPGIHHVLARVVKDIILRYKSMQGYYVPRRAGWDTHGLPVEMATEKALGLKSKKDIERIGVKEFNAKAKENVWLYKSEWENLTERIGYWLDLKNAYITYTSDYIESIWWTLKRIWERKLLYRGNKVVPWCARCGTALSSHELAQGYKETTDQSVYLRFKLLQNQKIKNLKVGDSAYILSWTTTPWTLPGNVALAVGKNIEYVGLAATSSNVAEIRRGDVFLLANNPEIFKKVFGDSLMFGPRGAVVNFFGKGEVCFEKLGSWFGEDLVGLEYEPLFNVKSLHGHGSCKIYTADFVTTTDGTGVVHTAVMYGEDDYKLGVKIGLPQYHTVDEEGKFTVEVPAGLAGMPVKPKDLGEARKTDEKIFTYLKEHGSFLRIEPYTHEYPYCWRCETPVIYYARTSWFIAMSKVRSALLAQNKKINWIPDYLKEGRFGEWLREVKDWNLSRERYWGTPIPIWECESCKAVEVIGSIEDLRRKAVQNNTFFFLRHGESRHNMENICGPSKDTAQYTSHVTPRGIKDIEIAARTLKKDKLDFIITSPLARARETAEIVSKVTGAPIEIREDIKDVNPGIFEWRSVKEHEAYFKSELEKFTKAPPGGESQNDVKRRMSRFFHEVNAKCVGKRILVVSHADPLWLLKGVIEGISNESLLKIPYPKTGRLYEINQVSLPVDSDGNVDLHRPYVDEIKLRCVMCKDEMRRVKEVVDVWYDSGAMPFAQSHYPFDCAKVKSEKLKVKSLEKFIDYPADFISEGMDQTRGWFYTLLAVATACGYGAPYKNVISLGLINDKNGQKMSKSRGNIIDPWEVIKKYGADAVRWYFYTMNPLGEPKNLDENDIARTFRKFHLIVWNSLKFWETYKAGSKVKGQGSSKNVLDQWIAAQLNETISKATNNLEKYDIREAALTIEAFVDDLSRWYIRRSRRRFQKPLSQEDHYAASETLRHVLMELAKLLAPFTPFFAEIMHQNLGVKESVHLEDWPEVKLKLSAKGGSASGGKTKNAKLIQEMQEIRQLSAAGLAARAAAGVKVRQPLKQLTVVSRKVKITNPELLTILADEVNVKEIVFDPRITANEVESDTRIVILDTTITPELREEGVMRELIRLVQDLRQEAHLEPKNKIALFLGLPEHVKSAIEKKEKVFMSEVGAERIEYRKFPKFEAEIYSKLDGSDVWIALRRA